MKNDEQAVLIINTKSRRGREWLGPVVEKLEHSPGITLVEKHASQDPNEIVRWTEVAVRRGLPLVIVGGGDGTFSSVARSFIGSKSALGVLPLGTGNQFARDLCIEAEVNQACTVLMEGIDLDVDVGLAGDGCFLNVATVGLTTVIARELTNNDKRRFGRIAYLFALTKAVRRVRPFRARLKSADIDESFETLQVVIGNGRFHGGPFPLAPDASIVSGELIVYALVGTSRWDLLRYAAKLPGGRHVELDNVQMFQSTGGELETKPIQRVTVDGETKLNTPIRFSISPRALRVRVPREFVEAQKAIERDSAVVR